jgi:ferredoxin
MANKNEKQPDNVPGQWYVDTNCISCGQCSEYAPSVFKPDESHDHNYVYRQPETEQEIIAAREAKESCPTDSIGDDGGETF